VEKRWYSAAFFSFSFLQDCSFFLLIAPRVQDLHLVTSAPFGGRFRPQEVPKSSPIARAQRVGGDMKSATTAASAADAGSSGWHGPIQSVDPPPHLVDDRRVPLPEKTR